MSHENDRREDMSEAYDKVDMKKDKLYGDYVYEVAMAIKTIHKKFKNRAADAGVDNMFEDEEE